MAQLRQMVHTRANLMKQLYFIRHGVSEMNKLKRWSGHIDTPLAPEGHEQAKKAGLQATEQGLRFDIIISSPLQRAHHTAQHIATHTGYPHEKIVVHDLFKERHFGSLEGMPAFTLGTTKYLLDEAAIDSQDNAESLKDLQKRADKAYAYLQNLDNDVILVVAHGAFGRALYRSVHNLPLTKRNIRYKNAEIVRFL